MSFKLQDRPAMTQWIMRKLGGPLVTIELSKLQLDDAINDAVQWFVSKKGIPKLRQIQIIPGQTDYPLDEDVDDVLDMIFTENALDFSTIFSPFAFVDKIPYDVFANPRGGGLYSSFTQALQYIETAKQIISVVPEWRVLHRTLQIFRANADTASTVAVMVYKSTTVDLEDLHMRDHDLVRRFALAEAKLSLSHVRGKYSQYPTAQGSLSMNADQLYKEAMTEKDSLEEQISQSGYPMGILVG